MTKPRYAVQITGCDIAYGERTLLSNLSFSLPFGRALTIIGRNGSGKSSLLRTLAGLNKVGRGQIRFNQQPFFLETGMPFQPALTVKENLNFWQHILNPQKNIILCEPVQYRLKNLWHCPVQFLSDGAQQYLKLVLLYFVPHRVWLVDEPLRSLDDATQDIIKNMFGNFISVGGSIIYTNPTATRFLGQNEDTVNVEDFKSTGPLV